MLHLAQVGLRRQERNRPGYLAPWGSQLLPLKTQTWPTHRVLVTISTLYVASTHDITSRLGDVPVSEISIVGLVAGLSMIP